MNNYIATEFGGLFMSQVKNLTEWIMYQNISDWERWSLLTASWVPVDTKEVPYWILNNSIKTVRHKERQDWIETEKYNPKTHKLVPISEGEND